VRLAKTSPDLLSGVVEVDESYIWRRLSAGKRGRGTKKAIMVIAVERVTERSNTASYRIFGRYPHHGQVRQLPGPSNELRVPEVAFVYVTGRAFLG